MTFSSVSPDLETLLRLGLAVVCGMAVGLNRAHHGTLPHPNRVRVHVLVGLSACLVVLAAGHGADARSRAIQGVATGVGFLGAGEILVAPPRGRSQPPEVHGLSSAASIWFTAALGVTLAAARPSLALVALLLALITLSDRRPNGSGGGPGRPGGTGSAGSAGNGGGGGADSAGGGGPGGAETGGDPGGGCGGQGDREKGHGGERGRRGESGAGGRGGEREGEGRGGKGDGGGGRGEGGGGNSDGVGTTAQHLPTRLKTKRRSVACLQPVRDWFANRTGPAS